MTDTSMPWAIRELLKAGAIVGLNPRAMMAEALAELAADEPTITFEAAETEWRDATGRLLNASLALIKAKVLAVYPDAHTVRLQGEPGDEGTTTVRVEWVADRVGAVIADYDSGSDDVTLLEELQDEELIEPLNWLGELAPDDWYGDHDITLR